MGEKATNDIKSIEKNLFDEINKLKILNNVIVHPKNNYFETLFSIGKYFDLIFDNCVNNDEKLKYLQTIINNFLSKNLIDDLYLSLTKLFNEIKENHTSKEVGNNLPTSFAVLLDIFARCSETNQEFGDEICKRENLIQFFVMIIKEYKLPCINGSLSETELKILELSIRNLYSTLIYDSEVNIHKLHKLKVWESLQYFEKCPNQDIKIRLALLVAYISEEKDSSGFVVDISSIPIIIKVLSDSVKTAEYSSKQEYPILELIKAVERLSKNDKNKRKMVEMGILPILKTLLETNFTKYRHISLSILLNLSYDERNKSEIAEKFLQILFDLQHLKTLKPKEQLPISTMNKPDNHLDKNASNQNIKGEIGTTFYIQPPTKESERALSQSNNPQIYGSQQDSASQKLNGLMSILTNYQKENIPSPPSDNNSQTNPSSNQKHVMISYCHENADFALKLYDELKARNFKLWIDKHDMRANQNLMEAMAQAVENSWAVIICISHCYKNSESCRAEAQYAKDNKKPLIPIIIQEKYRPDGWLGICITGIQYLNFSGKYSSEESMGMLVKQLEQFKNEQQKSEPTKPQIITDHSNLEQSNENQSNGIKLSDWSNSKVINWFRQIGIKKFAWKSHYTGSELEFLKSISGEKLLEFCQSELEIYDLKDIRILSEELKKL